MAVRLLDVLAHDLFTTFVSSTGVWRAQAKIRAIFVDVLQAMTGGIHNTSDKKCAGGRWRGWRRRAARRRQGR